MARPRLKIDYEEVKRLLHLGWGSRRIARKLQVSRSVVFRIISGQRPSSGPAPRPAAGWRTRRTETERTTTHQLLSLGRSAATDAEFADATERLDALLDARPDRSAASIYQIVKSELDATVRARRDAERRAAREHEEWERRAVDDLHERWNFEVRLALREFEGLEFSERNALESALDDEKDRAEVLLVRRMKEWETGAPMERLIDRLVAKGIWRGLKLRKAAAH